MATKIQLRRGTAAEWTAANPVLSSGEPGAETDTGKFKLGDGSTAWADLAYAIPATTGAAAAMLVGTSLEAQNLAGPATLDAASGAGVHARGWFNWFNAYMGQTFTLARNAGISSSLSAAQLAALPAELLAYDADWVLMGGPVNDIANDVPSATTIANLAAMHRICRAARKRIVQLTCAPSTSYSTTGRRTALADVNNYIHGLAVSASDVTIVDVWKLLANAATGDPATAMAHDTVVHYSPQAAERVGRAVYEAVSVIQPKCPPRVLGLLDPYNVIANPHLASGTGWSLLNATGRAVAYSAADDRGASKATITITGVTDGLESAIQCVEPIGNGRYVAGDVVQMTARLKWSGMVPDGSSGVPCLPFLRVYPRKADSSFTGPALTFTAASAEVPAGGGFPASGDLVAATTRITLPANVANLYVAAGWVGASAGVVEVSDIVVRKGA